MSCEDENVIEDELLTLKTTEEPPCTPGTSFKGTCGNTCRCHKNGFISCTQMGCEDEQLTEDLTSETTEKPSCTPGTTFQEENGSTCRCQESGIAICVFHIDEKVIEE
jgi:Pacifastin inhibitor (LCMII)